MKYADLQNKSKDELQEMLTELQIKLGKFSFELANKTLTDTSQLGKTKKDVARILTAIKSSPIK